MITGGSYRVEGNLEDVEQIIVDAARGSILELARLKEAESGRALALNPEHVVTLRAAGP